MLIYPTQPVWDEKDGSWATCFSTIRGTSHLSMSLDFMMWFLAAVTFHGPKVKSCLLLLNMFEIILGNRQLQKKWKETFPNWFIKHTVFAHWHTYRFESSLIAQKRDRLHLEVHLHFQNGSEIPQYSCLRITTFFFLSNLELFKQVLCWKHTYSVWRSGTVWVHL